MRTLRIALMISVFSTLSYSAIPPATSFAGTYECAALNRDMPDRRPYYRLPVTVTISGTQAKVTFKEPNRGNVSFGGGPLKETSSDDGWEWRSGDYQQYIAVQQTQVGRFLTLTHQEGEFRYSAVGCMKKK